MTTPTTPNPDGLDNLDLSHIDAMREDAEFVSAVTDLATMSGTDPAAALDREIDRLKAGAREQEAKRRAAAATPSGPVDPANQAVKRFRELLR